MNESIVNLMELMIISAVENQYTKIHLTSWKMTTDSGQFWAEVFQYKDASGENPNQEHLCGDNSF